MRSSMDRDSGKDKLSKYRNEALVWDFLSIGIGKRAYRVVRGAAVPSAAQSICSQKVEPCMLFFIFLADARCGLASLKFTHIQNWSTDKLRTHCK
jgi:hypothetical protein